MRSILRGIILLFWGLLIWAIPFGVIYAYSVFSLDKYLDVNSFNSISQIIYVAVISGFLAGFFKRVWKKWGFYGLMVGLFWSAISIGLDLKFIVPDNNWSVPQYFIQYGYRYAMLPIPDAVARSAAVLSF